jgi:hypothetical protein
MNDVEKYAENNPSLYEQHYLHTAAQDSILSRRLREQGETSFEDDMATSPGEYGSKNQSFCADHDGSGRI